MTTYNASAVDDAVISHKKGITLQQGRALRDNPIAMFEGAAGAPRLATKTKSLDLGINSTGILTGFDDWTGLFGWGSFENISGAINRLIEISIGDATTFATASTLVDINANSSGHVFFFLDIASGLLKSSYFDGDVERGYTTLALPAGDVTRIQFETEQDATFSCLYWLNGGESAA